MAFLLPPHRAWPCLLAAASVTLVAASSTAHGLDAGRYTVEREGLVVRVVGTPRSADLRAFDDDGDGLLARHEVRAHRAELRAAVDAGFVVTADDGSAPICEPTDVSTPGSGDPRVVDPRADHLRFTRICRFERAPTALRVHDRFLEGGTTQAPTRLPSIIDAVEVSPPVNGSRTLLRDVETIVLTSSAPAATVLRERGSVPTASGPERITAELPARPRARPWSALLIIALAAVPSLVLRRQRRRLASSLLSSKALSPSPSSPEARPS